MYGLVSSHNFAPQTHRPPSHFLLCMKPRIFDSVWRNMQFMIQRTYFLLFCYAGKKQCCTRRIAYAPYCLHTDLQVRAILVNIYLQKHLKNSAISNSLRIDFRTTLMNVQYILCRKFMLFANTYTFTFNAIISI